MSEILVTIKYPDAGDEDYMIVYVDGTYRCDHWEPDSLSKWRILDGIFEHMHEGGTEWDRSEHSGWEETNEYLVNSILLAISEKEILGDASLSQLVEETVSKTVQSEFESQD